MSVRFNNLAVCYNLVKTLSVSQYNSKQQPPRYILRLSHYAVMDNEDSYSTM